jgi:predicted nucleotidyltransferase
MEKVLNQLVERLQKAYGERLLSVVLYGSAAADDHQARFSDFNVLCVLGEITRRELDSAEEIFRWWREHGNASPLLLTEDEMAASTDCFAIEFNDIKRQHRVLYGKDVVAPLVLDNCFYRAQVEHDLRAKLLRLRQKACGMMSDTDLLRRLLLDSVSTFCVLFRHALVLHGVDAPATKRAVIESSRQHFGIDAVPFERLLDVREERIKPREVEPVPLLASYLQGISTVIAAVNQVEKQVNPQ